MLIKMYDFTNEVHRPPPSYDYRIAKIIGLETIIYAVSLWAACQHCLSSLVGWGGRGGLQANLFSCSCLGEVRSHKIPYLATHGQVCEDSTVRLLWPHKIATRKIAASSSSTRGRLLRHTSNHMACDLLQTDWNTWFDHQHFISRVIYRIAKQPPTINCRLHPAASQEHK